MDADSVEVRVLGCLIEKQRITPDQYPLSLNALRLAANQVTNREPVVDYDEGTIRAALDRLGRRGWTRLASGPGSRVAKFRHLLDEALRSTPSQLALLAVLMLRGPQTVAELRTRSERLYPFPSADDVEQALLELAEGGLVERLPRRPGEREERWVQLLGGDDSTRGESPTGDVVAPSDHDDDPLDLEERVARLEQQLTELLERVDELQRGWPALSTPGKAIDYGLGMSGPQGSCEPMFAAEHPIDPEVRIGHVHLRTVNIDRVRAFYVDIMGFDVVFEARDVPGWGTTGDLLFVSAGGYHHHLGFNTWKSAGGSPQPDGVAGLHHVALNFSTRAKLAETVQRLIDADVPLRQATDTARTSRYTSATPTETISSSPGTALPTSGRATAARTHPRSTPHSISTNSSRRASRQARTQLAELRSDVRERTLGFTQTLRPWRLPLPGEDWSGLRLLGLGK